MEAKPTVSRVANMGWPIRANSPAMNTRASPVADLLSRSLLQEWGAKAKRMLKSEPD